MVGFCVLLQIRSETLNHHPGEIGFPGGARENSDSDFIDTMYRETKEEMGEFDIAPSVIDIEIDDHGDDEIEENISRELPDRRICKKCKCRYYY